MQINVKHWLLSSWSAASWCTETAHRGAYGNLYAV